MINPYENMDGEIDRERNIERKGGMKDVGSRGDGRSVGGNVVTQRWWLVTHAMTKEAEEQRLKNF